MGQCKKCGTEARYDLYYWCYTEQNEGLAGTENVETEVQEEKSAKDLTFHENMIKGRIAETLIEELFLAMGYRVYHYGMENTIPGVMKLLRGVGGGSRQKASSECPISRWKTARGGVLH